ncbi:MAG: Fic family protein, partial [Bacteroidales bacterium]|nr:Fic family protein [Bacteroidales bacterium]
MIKVTLTNEMLKRILSIEECRQHFGSYRMPISLSNKLRKSSKKKSSYASTRIEGNPLTESQSDEVIEAKNRHFLKPEQEVRNYFAALELSEKFLKEHKSFSMGLILALQKQIVMGESRDKVGLRGPMPPGVLFAVYDDKTRRPEYIPPMWNEVRHLLDELILYVNNSDDHPLIKAAVVHYQMVTIHPFEDGNGRTARILSDYILDYYDFGFNQIGSLEEYFAYDVDEYYASLQMDLPPLYYDGRDNPPHPEIWVHYFLRMVELHSKKVVELASASVKEQYEASLSFLNKKAKAFVQYGTDTHIDSFTQSEMASVMKVT